MKARSVVIGLGVIAAGAIVVWQFASRSEPVRTEAQRATPTIPVTAGTAEARDMPVFVTGLGTVQAINTVTVKTRVDGPITEVFFKEGQEVKAGDRLFQIDPRPFQAALEQAQATRQKDEAQLQGAQLTLDRYAKLVGPGYQTRQSYDDQKATVAQLQASIKADQAVIDTAKLNLDYTLIRAPIDGRTGQRTVDAGNLVQASQGTPLVTIAQLRPAFVSFTVPQEQLDAIRRNQAEHALEVVAYGGDDKTVLSHGTLTLIDNQVDTATGTVHLKATFDNADERLWPGGLVNARLILSTRHDAVTVPAEALMQGPNGSFAYVIKGDDSVERRDVQVVATQEGLAVIDKGLAAGDRIVVDGQYRLTDGAKVRLDQPKQTEASQQSP